MIGRAIRLDGGVVTVAGVMPAGFDQDADFWVALTGVAGHGRDDRQFTLFARLKGDATLRAAAAELSAISRGLAGVGLLLALVALAACYRPARAAATADPLPLLWR
ncbi:MAG: ABC transporter permease [Vicinamibacterales bacterium]